MSMICTCAIITNREMETPDGYAYVEWNLGPDPDPECPTHGGSNEEPDHSSGCDPLYPELVQDVLKIVQNQRTVAETHFLPPQYPYGGIDS